MSCSICRKKYGIGRKQRECHSCTDQICSKCSTMFDGRDLGWVKPQLTCSKCAESLKGMILKLMSPRPSSPPPKETAPAPVAETVVETPQQEAEEHAEERAEEPTVDEEAPPPQASEEPKTPQKAAAMVPVLHIEQEKPPVAVNATEKSAGGSSVEGPCCPLCSGEFGEDNEEVICSECASMTCARCAPTFKLSSLGESVARRVCSQCFPQIQSKVQKSPRFIANQSCPSCHLEYDNLSHGKRSCSECSKDVCASCAPNYRLVSLGETRRRRICAECLPDVKQQVAVSKSPRALSPRVLSPRPDDDDAAAPPPAQQMGAFGLRIRTGTVLQGAIPGKLARPVAEEKNVSAEDTVGEQETHEEENKDEEKEEHKEEKNEEKEATLVPVVMDSGDSSSVSEEAPSPPVERPADVLSSSKGLFKAGGHRAAPLLRKKQQLVEEDESYLKPRRDTLSTPIQISDDEEDSSSSSSEGGD